MSFGGYPRAGIDRTLGARSAFVIGRDHQAGDRIGVVSGGASGIGKAVAERLKTDGLQVVLLDVDASVRDVATALDGRAFVVDVTDPASVERTIDTIEGDIGPISAAVTCAGVTQGTHFLDVSIEDWSRLLAINLTGTFLVCQAVARRMAPRRRGALVTTASVTAERATTRRSAYAATKGGVISLTRGMAIDLARYRIRANCIAPGAVDTPLATAHHAGADAGIGDRWRAQTPMGRYGQADEIASAISFLVSDDAAFVTGQVLAADGGFLAAGMLLDAKA